VLCYVGLPSDLCLGADVAARPCGRGRIAKCIKPWACLVQDAVVADGAFKAEVERLPWALRTVWYREAGRKEAKGPTNDAGTDGSADEEATHPTTCPRAARMSCESDRAGSCASAGSESSRASCLVIQR